MRIKTPDMERQRLRWDTLRRTEAFDRTAARRSDGNGLLSRYHRPH